MGNDTKEDDDDFIITDSLQEGLDAIAEIHKVLDDDKNGAVDSLESEDFIREDLSINDDEQEDKRQLSLHQGDNAISVVDLQKNWLNSEVHKWSAADVEEWLQDVVGLPQYLPIFRKLQIDGNVLPRLALNTGHLIQDKLGITDLNHKNKLILKAMDLVLFGPPTAVHSPLKDAILAIAIIVAICGLFLSTMQKNRAQSQINKMLQEIDSLQINEEKFIEMQSILQEAETKNENVIKEKLKLEQELKKEIDVAKSEAERLCEARKGTEAEVKRLQLAEEELLQVRLALKNAESKRFDEYIKKELQSHLKVTYRKEKEHYNIKKVAAEKQLEEAKLWGFKMKKKTGVINSLKMIHGNSLEVVENRILSARTALIDATNDLQELFTRWKRIESLCDFSITNEEVKQDTLGSNISLTGSQSDCSSPEPNELKRSHSTPNKATALLKDNKASSLKLKSELRNRKKNNYNHHDSTPDLSKSSDSSLLDISHHIIRNHSSTGIKDMLNGHSDLTDSDDSGITSKKRRGRTLWRMLRESRTNSDSKWKSLIENKTEV